MFLDAAWKLIQYLDWGGLAAALAGVVVFGWHFIRINAAAAQGDSAKVPSSSWRGRGARSGYMLVAIGAGMQIASLILAVSVPGRH
jgi:hypothetical protein